LKSALNLLGSWPKEFLILGEITLIQYVKNPYITSFLIKIVQRLQIHVDYDLLLKEQKILIFFIANARLGIMGRLGRYIMRDMRHPCNIQCLLQGKLVLFAKNKLFQSPRSKIVLLEEM